MPGDHVSVAAKVGDLDVFMQSSYLSCIKNIEKSGKFCETSSSGLRHVVCGNGHDVSGSVWRSAA